MQISNSGRVVLIDDTIDEALPLMTTFGKNAIPFLYFDGRPERLPEIPLKGIRFVFLDIELQGLQGQSEKNKASALVGRLKKIISSSNGPYVIVFWTKHSEIIDKILQNCKRAAISPKAWIDLDKIQCRQEDGSYSIDDISCKLNSKLISIGAFKLYIEWENILHLASTKFITDFSNHIPNGQDWSKNTSSLFYKLYRTFTDEKLTHDVLIQFKCACILMNRSFLDTLQNYISRHLSIPDGFKLEHGNIASKTLAKLNTSLFLIETILDKPVTGYLYTEKGRKTKSILIENMFKEGNAPDNSQLCTVVITPECDISNQKTLKVTDKLDPINSQNVHRVVHGIIYDMKNDVIKDEYKRLIDKGKDSRFVIGPFWFKNKCKVVIINFASISFKHENQLSNKPLFGLRRDLMFDLQSKAANHVNRLGNFQLS